MSDFKARHIIEALRSGIPSRAVGAYFSEARPGILRRINDRMDAVRETGRSDGMVFTGRYGEGKTHLLNTVFNMASTANMVVSYVSLGKESPIDKPYQLYPKLIANTYLPGSEQPGFRSQLEQLTQGSSVMGELLAYAARELETDKLYYLLRAYLGTQEEEERQVFLNDLEGDFTTGAVVKRSFRRITGKPAKFNQTFSKSKHGMDYFHFMSHLFKLLGYSGWVMLFDEAELIGRMPKLKRVKSYRQMQTFLKPDSKLEGVFSLFAFSASFAEDVIDKKREQDNVEAALAGDADALKAASATLNAVLSAPELAPLTKDEITRVLMSIQEFHGRAYGWQPQLSPETLLNATEAAGYLLRTKIRTAIELLDQLYQYGEAGSIRVTELGREVFDEDDTPELPDMEDL